MRWNGSGGAAWIREVAYPTLRHGMRTIPFYTLLLPISIYTDWYLNLRLQMEFMEYLLPLLVVLVLFIAVTLLLVRPTGSLNKAGVATFTLGFMLILLPRVIPGVVPESTRLYIVGVATLAAFGLLLYGLRRLKSPILNLTLIMNICMTVICLPNLFQITKWEIEVAPHRLQAQEMLPDIQALPPAADGPDVWHFVFDRYAGAETLERVYGYDNSAFLSELDKRGFSVARKAQANYHQTVYSLLSTLNLGYLDELAAHVELRRDDWVPIYRALRENRVGRLFNQMGYRVYQAGSWWESTRYAPAATENINFLSMPEFGRSMLQNSLVGPLLASSGLGIGDGRQDQCRRTVYQFRRMGELASLNERKFVFAHMLVPHPPFVFKPDGSCKRVSETAAASRSTNYLDQVQYVNREILSLVDAILAGPRPALIILQADEGPWPERFVDNELFGTKDRIYEKRLAFSHEELREKMLILYAVRAPGSDRIPLRSDSTPINLYRHILNTYFGHQLSLLPERNFVVPSISDLYEVEEVTPLLH